MNFCSHCGHQVSRTIPEGDNRLRHVCEKCRTIHYQNPKIIAGCLPIWQDKILFCRRAIEPRHGLWTLPAGFMENNETALQAALRESQEEACADIVDPQLYGVYNIPRVSQVYVLFRGHLRAEDSFDIGSESLEVRLFSEEQIPWDEIAFKVMDRTIKRYLEERKHGDFSVAHEDIE